MTNVFQTIHLNPLTRNDTAAVLSRDTAFTKAFTLEGNLWGPALPQTVAPLRWGPHAAAGAAARGAAFPRAACGVLSLLRRLDAARGFQREAARGGCGANPEERKGNAPCPWALYRISRAAPGAQGGG